MRSTRDLLVTTCGVLAIVLVFVPYYGDMFGQSFSPADLYRHPHLTTAAAPSLVLGLLVLSAICVLAARARERLASPAQGWRRGALGCAAGATAAALVNAVAFPTRLFVGTACFGWGTESSDPHPDCADFGEEWVPSVGFLLASLAAVMALVVCLSRSAATGRLRRVPRPPSRWAVPAAVVGGAIAVIGSMLPVYRHFAWGSDGDDGEIQLPAVDWTAWHGVVAPAAVVLVVLAATATLVPAGRRVARPTALLGLVAAVECAFAVPLGQDSTFRSTELGGMRVNLAMTWFGWGWGVLLAGAVAVLLGAAAVRTDPPTAPEPVPVPG